MSTHYTTTRVESLADQAERSQNPYGRKLTIYVYDEAARPAADSEAATIRAMLPNGSPLHSSGIAAAKAYAKAVGTHGAPGGWIYTSGGRPICQGWAEYACIVNQRGRIRPVHLGTIVSYHAFDVWTGQEVITNAYAWEVVA